MNRGSRCSSLSPLVTPIRLSHAHRSYSSQLCLHKEMPTWAVFASTQVHRQRCHVGGLNPNAKLYYIDCQMSAIRTPLPIPRGVLRSPSQQSVLPSSPNLIPGITGHNGLWKNLAQCKHTQDRKSIKTTENTTASVGKKRKSR